MLPINKICSKYFMILFILFCLPGSGCKKFVEIDPPATDLTTLSAFKEDNTAIAVMTGHFSYVSQLDLAITSFTGISRFTGLSSDELRLWEGVSDAKQIGYFTNDLFSQEGASAGDEYWPYTEIYACNTIIEGVSNSDGLTAAVKNQLLGEAKFMRAFYFFNLVNLYGDIPMPTSTVVKVNIQLVRTPKKQVYEQIIKDLKEAEALLSPEYLNWGLKKYSSAIERVRPTSWAASALLARVYLYNEDWSNADQAASKLISNTGLFGLDALNEVFKKNSREAIWQLQTVFNGMNTGDGGFFILTSFGLNEGNPVYLSLSLLSAFETGDARAVPGNWVDKTVISGTTYYYPFKYKMSYGSTQGAEYIMMLRLAEQYLIRAEARTRLGNVNGARDDLFAIRRRAGLVDATLTANDQGSLLTAVMHERQVELFTEGGHRWFDLKRTGNIDAVMNVVTPTKGGTWQSTDQLYPLPFRDLQRDRNLTQNPGY